MENKIIKDYQLPKSIVNKVKKKGINLSMIEACDFIEPHKQNHLWHGRDLDDI